MPSQLSNRIFCLLDAIRKDHPRRQKAAEELMRRLGLDDKLQLLVDAPKHVSKLPTFDCKVWRPLTPMLKARFDYAGSWRRGREVWLDPDEMSSYIENKAVRECHRALRHHFDNSAPMLFRDDRIGLFGATVDVPEDVTYLVWKNDYDEPEIWSYDDYDFHCAPDLEQFLRWRLERP